MENFYLSALVGELRRELMEHAAGRVLLAGKEILFELRPSDGRALLASFNRADPSLFLTSRSLKQFAKESSSAPPFAAHLRKYIAGAEIVSITKPPLDRLVHLEFEKFDVSGDRQRSRLLLALTGRSANAYLFDSEKRLIAMLDERGALPDETWLREPAADFDPATLQAELTAAMTQAEVGERFFGKDSIFAPLLRNEFVARCRKLSPPDAMHSLLDDLFARAPQPAIYSRLPLEEAENRLINPKADLLLSHIPLVQAEGFDRRRFTTLSEAADVYAGLRERQEALRNEYSRTRQLLTQAVKKQETTLAALRRDRERFDDPERLKRYGDLLLANLATARVNGSTARVVDYYDAEQPEIDIAVDENKPLQQVAAGYFTRYQKAQRAIVAIDNREQEITKKTAPLKQLLESLEGSTTADEIGRMRATAERALGIKPITESRPDKKAKKKNAQASRRFRTTDGFEVLVGKSDRENDELTFRVARPTDIWLHAADYPGSHVVIRNPARGDVPQRSIMEAAELAAFYSQAKREAKAAVHYTQRKFISKPPRAKPGLVRLSSFKTILVEPRCVVEKIE